ncbi:B-cell receptor CD22 isoform X1 [Elephas maximus indicus]|uniref:B-cell receptor CD22 isoform X1 n=2 Tax=Elephas maximus indicus TaxID=99487 RepID=UPI00211682EB|nr:B-cell receptor CD22 isoform X1 [Elephas maximus indicus]XP_049757041.1 B-cell receptor CD22 isoform X1 [Elephas maximus indicus]XP_049757042.1 B-cell receptor CD22 isoform X1 [Elephas maximus indicus]
MRLFGPSLLLLEYLAFSDSASWKVDHPGTLYSWEGACVWIPCLYKTPYRSKPLESFTVYHNFKYDNITKNFTGTILYTNKEALPYPEKSRVEFLGNYKNNCSLHIETVHVNDSGQLGLRMTAGTDKWMEPINLNVSEKPPPPHIQLPLEIQESQEVTLTCSLNFTCPGYQIQLQWSLEESAVTLISMDPKTVSTESKLTFHPNWTHHGQNLTCQLKDNSGEMLSQETVQLNVNHSPKLKIEISSGKATVMEGESVIFACLVISSNPEHGDISWFKDSTKLIMQKTNVLTLSTVTKRDSGKYHCQSFNSVGAGKSEDVVLHVQFTPEPSSVQIVPSPANEGEMVELTCTSLAYPPPTNYTWYHNGQEVQGRREKNFQIPKLLLCHAGNYSCLAENSLGPGEIGQEAELDIQYAPKGVTMVIQNPTPIREGDDVTLVCNYNSSNPRVTEYKWKPEASKNKSFPEVMMIRKVTWDVKPITCEACNLWCSKAPFVTLDVHYAPKDVRVLKISPRTEIHSGHPVLLRCDFSRSHPMDVRFFWKKNGSFLEEGQELSFDSISPEDAGHYSCLVNNSIGQTTSEAWMLQVLYKPRGLRVSIAPQDRVMEGKKATLTCESDANPPVSWYTWFDWNNQNLHHAAQTLRLEPVNVKHSGAYWCQGNNQLGMGQSPPSTLTVYYSPETIGKRAALGIGVCLSIFILAIWGVKVYRSWKKIREQQELQENSSGQSFFVKNKKIRRAGLSEGPHSLGCYNPAMEDGISYAALRFPFGETDTPGADDVGTSASVSNMEDMVTYSVVQKRRVVPRKESASSHTAQETQSGGHHPLLPCLSSFALLSTRNGSETTVIKLEGQGEAQARKWRTRRHWVTGLSSPKMSAACTS